MGWRLAEEVAWMRPERPGLEWWTLLDIAQDANDISRQGWPGRDYLAQRAKKSPRTIDRYLRLLVSAGLLVCLRPAAPGRRPIFQIAILFELSTTGDTEGVARSSDTEDVARSLEGYPQRATDPASTCDMHSVSHPPSGSRQTTALPVDGGSVEGTQLSTAGPPAKEVMSAN